MDQTFAGLPFWLLALDYLLGAVMWTLIGRFAMGLFLPENSDWFFMKAFVRMTDPVMRVFKPVTPSFLIQPMVPLFVAWFFYMLRFYVLPPLFGYGIMGTLSFPLESEIARGLYQIFN